ncbi:hypothetical protein Tco_0860199 [Tanacetum coccineum]|uniref:Uncharacterized protein n=1 Tax=Tanacetum coccineum TaxID=301880 RepID=A0ABQ5BGG9_9ASTR
MSMEVLQALKKDLMEEKLSRKFNCISFGENADRFYCKALRPTFFEVSTLNTREGQECLANFVQIDVKIISDASYLSSSILRLLGSPFVYGDNDDDEDY